MKTLNILYKNKKTGRVYIRFEVDATEKIVRLFDTEDKSGRGDLGNVSIETLNNDYEEVDRYEEEEED